MALLRLGANIVFGYQEVQDQIFYVSIRIARCLQSTRDFGCLMQSWKPSCDRKAASSLQSCILAKSLLLVEGN